MGVITTCHLEEGCLFGPVPPTMTLADPIVLIGHRTCDTLPDIHTVKLDVLAFSTGSRLAEWVPYVQAARDSMEQNMEAMVDDGQLFFRVTRDVSSGSELLIWYSDKLAARIGVPEVKDDHLRGDSYCCSKCQDSFLYPNCLRAHMRFRCKYRQQLVLGTAPTQPTCRDSPAGNAVGDRCRNNNNNNRKHSPRCQGDPEDGSRPASSNTPPSYHAGSSPIAPKATPVDGDQKQNRRRRPEEDLQSRGSSPAAKQRHVSRQQEETHNIARRYGNTPDAEDLSAFQSVSNRSSSPSRSPHNSVSSPSISSGSSPATSFGLPMTSSQSSVLTPTTALNMTTASGPMSIDKSAAAVAAAAAMFGAAGLFLFPGMSQAAAAARAAALPLGAMHHERMRQQQLPVAAVAAAAAAAMHSTNENASRIHPAAINGLNHNNNNNNSESIPVKHPALGGPFIGPPPAFDPRFALPYVYRSPNPMVDKMLNMFGSEAAAAAAVASSLMTVRGPGAPGLSGPPSLPPPPPPPSIQSTFPALNLAQNWCAKCNTSFRMTSDLVYHMRSHHKREFDPVKRRKDDKLRCDVCGETFRERHHLTRHMTSHS